MVKKICVAQSAKVSKAALGFVWKFCKKNYFKLPNFAFLHKNKFLISVNFDITSEYFNVRPAYALNQKSHRQARLLLFNSPTVRFLSALVFFIQNNCRTLSPQTGSALKSLSGVICKSPALLNPAFKNCDQNVTKNILIQTIMKARMSQSACLQLSLATEAS